MAIYISRRYKILYITNCQVELVFKGHIKARVRHGLFVSTKEVDKSEDIWRAENVLFWVENYVLSLAEVFYYNVVLNKGVINLSLVI